MSQTSQPGFQRTKSSTSLARLYNGPSGSNPAAPTEEELADPRTDFCNSFWGQGDRGYEVVMARLRGSGRTMDELRIFWKERYVVTRDGRDVSDGLAEQL
jgi:hypothetical protein